MISKKLYQSLLLILFFSIFLGENSMALSGPDPDRMESVEFELSGDLRLTVSLPKDGLSKDVPRGNVLRRVDIEEIQAYAMLVDDLWDWRGGFWRSVNGGVAIKIFVNRVPYGSSLDCESDIRQMLHQQFANHTREFFAAGGQKKYLSQFVIAPGLLQLGNLQGVVYRESNGYDAENVIVPITDKVYLELKFTFLAAAGSKIEPPPWRVKAEEMKDVILRSMQFAGDWKPIRDCRIEPSASSNE